jgi:hypothetical protein
MSAQVNTARSDRTDMGNNNNNNNVGSAPARAAAVNKVRQGLEALTEDESPAAIENQPPPKFIAPSIDIKQPSYQAPPGYQPTPANYQPTPIGSPPANARPQSEPDSLEPPLPAGWKKVPSQSRPGAFSYLNTNTGERVAERPSRPASSGGPLPPGWKKVPSQSRPGEFVYLNVNTGERIAWRPTAQDGSRPGQPVSSGLHTHHSYYQ